MTDSVAEREHDVRSARDKLTADLAALRSPANLREFTAVLKHEAVAAKDSVVQQTKDSVQSAVEGVVVDLKSKASSNPAAVLAIGAGIAWQLLRNPPIVTALIGVGLYSLLRTPSSGPAARNNREYLDQGAERLKQQVSGFGTDAVGVAADVGQTVFEKGAQLYDSTKAKMHDLTLEAVNSASMASSAVRERTDGLAASARRTFHDALDQVEEVATSSAGAAASRLRENAHSTTNSTVSIRDLPRGSRDTILIGVAGVAVAAALGIAVQKRIARNVD
jgi:hypothetical protein